MEEQQVEAEDRETEILRCLERAMSRVPECDSIVIIMQLKGDNGHVWFGPDSSTIAETNWMLDVLKTYLHRAE